MRRSASAILTASSAAALAACHGAQSALDPGGRDAEVVFRLFVVMAAAAVAIWLAVVALAIYAPLARPPQSSRPHAALILGGGVAFPLVVLTAHLTYGLSSLPRMIAPAPAGAVTIEVTGAQWWWRVRYHLPGRAPIELANELWLPLGERANVRLFSRDVVHSFWVPSLAGKLDAIPGRMNVLPLQPTRAGIYRGACAEFCGASHARMNLLVVVVDRGRFDRWIDDQARPAIAAGDAIASAGEQVFFSRGCAACHTVRGTAAQGRVGPDLTHVGSRQSIAAGTMPMTSQDLRRWISGSDVIKPEAHMPAFSGLVEQELTGLAAYLLALK